MNFRLLATASLAAVAFCTSARAQTPQPFPLTGADLLPHNECTIVQNGMMEPCSALFGSKSGTMTLVTLDPGDNGLDVHVTDPITGFALDNTVSSAAAQNHTDLLAIFGKQPAAPALETGHLAAIDASTATDHSDLTGIATNTAPGTAITGATIPAGGAGPVGWLSAIWKAVTGTLTVTGSVTEANSASILAKLPTNTAPLQQGGSVSVSNLPTTQAISAAALPLPAGAATAANQALDVSGTGSIASATTINSAYAIALLNHEGVVGFRVSGVTASGAVLTPEISNDGGTTWNGAGAVVSGLAGAPSPTIAADGQFRVNVGGHTNVRLRVSTAGGTAGAISINYFASSQNPLVVDPNNAPFSGVVALTVGGAAVAAGRSLGANCTSAGTITMSFADASSLTLPVAVGWQTFPFAITGVSAATGSCSSYNLK